MKRLIKIAVACGLLLGSGAVLAQSYGVVGNPTYGTGDKTNAGVVIQNTATVTYSVDDVEQEAEINDPAAEFRVDRVILVTVANTDVGGEVSVVPAAEDRYLSFTVTNDSNATIDLLLDYQQLTGELPDEFDATDLTFWVEDGTTPGSFQSGEDTEITGTMRLAAMTENEDRTVYIVGNIPDSSSVADLDQASIVLLATAYELDGTTLIEETNETFSNEDVANVDNTTADGDPLATNTGAMVMDTVFGDMAGDYGDDADPDVGLVDDLDEDGQHSDTGTFVIGSASITVTKTSFVLNDPFNGDDNPKAIPGAEVLYCITVANTGGTAAENVSVKDPIPSGTTYVEDSIEVFTAATTCDADAVDAGFPITDEDSDAVAEADDNLNGVAALAIHGNSGDAAATVPEAEGEAVNTIVPTVADTSGVTVTIFRVTIN